MVGGRIRVTFLPGRDHNSPLPVGFRGNREAITVIPTLRGSGGKEKQ